MEVIERQAFQVSLRTYILLWTRHFTQSLLHHHVSIHLFFELMVTFFFFMFIKIFLRLLKNFKFIKILLNSYTNQYVVRCNCCIVYLLPPPVGAQTRRPDSI